MPLFYSLSLIFDHDILLWKCRVLPVIQARNWTLKPSTQWTTSFMWFITWPWLIRWGWVQVVGCGLHFKFIWGGFVATSPLCCWSNQRPEVNFLRQGRTGNPKRQRQWISFHWIFRIDSATISTVYLWITKAISLPNDEFFQQNKTARAAAIVQNNRQMAIV